MAQHGERRLCGWRLGGLKASARKASDHLLEVVEVVAHVKQDLIQNFTLGLKLRLRQSIVAAGRHAAAVNLWNVLAQHLGVDFAVAFDYTELLDEVGELPLGTQVRLLRVLETGEFIKVGSSKAQKVNVRVVGATNVDMLEKIDKGQFREDLYYRLNTVEISLPPLRERKGDIHLLFRKFAQDFSQKYRVPAVRLSDEAVRVLETYRWPGNIRELANAVEHALVLCDELPLSIAHLPSRFASLRPTEVVATSVAVQPVPAVEAVVPGSGRPESLRELEMRAILEGLERNKGNKARTAEELGISLKTLYNKLHQLNDGPLDKTG